MRETIKDHEIRMQISHLRIERFRGIKLLDWTPSRAKSMTVFALNQSIAPT
jgi:hypothetical protein